MKPLSIREGHITLRLSPSQCAMIARACRFAGEETFGGEVEVWRTMGTLFQACAIAGFAQWHMGAGDLQALDDEMKNNQL